MTPKTITLSYTAEDGTKWQCTKYQVMYQVNVPR